VRLNALGMRVAVVVVGVVILAGCGSAGRAAKVASVAKVQWNAKSGACKKKRSTVALGRVVDLYVCTLHDAHVPPAQQVAGDFGSTTQHRCYSYADGRAFDVTERFGGGCTRNR
jgi:hypothetical protein